MRDITKQVKDLTLSDGDIPPPASLQLDSFPQKNALIASIRPPREPYGLVGHVPCDIVLIIDSSRSMLASASVPDSPSELLEFSILDLVKHAARTIISTMDHNDRLSIVTFNKDARTVQNLMKMTMENKDTAFLNICGIKTKLGTNLWQGISTGLELLKKADSTGKVPAIIILTDGRPTTGPEGGYIESLRKRFPLPGTIHIFGFGYRLSSGLLKSIAEVGNGNYSFIPDAGMISTVFEHAVANLQNTYATEAILQLRSPRSTEITEVMRTSGLSRPPAPILSPSKPWLKLDISLGNIQYGQSRDIFLRFQSPPVSKNRGTDPKPIPIEATIEYKAVLSNKLGKLTSDTVSHNLMDRSSMSEAKVAYHESRAEICSFLLKQFPIIDGGQRHAKIIKYKKRERSDVEINGCDGFEERIHWDQVVPPDRLAGAAEALGNLIRDLPSKKFSDPLNKSLIRDLVGKKPSGERLGIKKRSSKKWGSKKWGSKKKIIKKWGSKKRSIKKWGIKKRSIKKWGIKKRSIKKKGSKKKDSKKKGSKQPGGQISIAFRGEGDFLEWGQHYLLSLLSAHSRQVCLSMHDAGPFQYGRNSPLFRRCRKDMEKYFSILSPLVPSRQSRQQDLSDLSARRRLERRERREKLLRDSTRSEAGGNQGAEFQYKDLALRPKRIPNTTFNKFTGGSFQPKPGELIGGSTRIEASGNQEAWRFNKPPVHKRKRD